MNATKTAGDCRVFLRAFEGIFILCFALACLAASWYLRKNPLF